MELKVTNKAAKFGQIKQALSYLSRDSISEVASLFSSQVGGEEDGAGKNTQELGMKMFSLLVANLEEISAALRALNYNAVTAEEVDDASFSEVQKWAAAILAVNKDEIPMIGAIVQSQAEENKSQQKEADLKKK